MGYKLKRIMMWVNNQEKQVRPTWKPGANTVAYYPLTSTTTVNDKSGNGYTLTRTNGTFGVYHGVDCVYVNNYSNPLSNSSITFTAKPLFTMMAWVYIEGTSTSLYQGLFEVGTVSRYGKLSAWFKYNTGLAISSGYAGYEAIKSGNINGGWHLVVNINNGDISSQYLDGVFYQSFTNSLTQNLTSAIIGNQVIGCVSEVILEKKARTAQEISNYYNQTKANYGL